MSFSDFMSVIQLAAGLNTAYFSFSQLRLPAFEAEQRALDRLAEIIGRQRQGSEESGAAGAGYDLYLQLRIDLDTIRYASQRKDGIFGKGCLVAAIIYVALLIFGSFYAQTELSFLPALVISTFGFLPIAASFVVNVAASQQVRSKITRRRQELERTVFSGSQERYDRS